MRLRPQYRIHYTVATPHRAHTRNVILILQPTSLALLNAAFPLAKNTLSKIKATTVLLVRTRLPLCEQL